MRLPLASVVLAGSLAFAAPPGLRAQIVDHDDLAGVAALPQTTMDAIGEQRWLFTHASVGGNMVAGLGDLHAADAGRYQLTTSSVGYNSAGQRANNPPATTTPGTVYECQRGNPGWSTKFTIFDNSVRVSGWREPKVDVAMDKLCYIDQSASAAAYVSMMTALAADYPDTVFVYTTMPLTTGEDAANVLRNEYNRAVREHCAATGALLFDIADMEAYDESGVAQTFEHEGVTYFKLADVYTDDGGHLNSVGRQRIARGWYAVAAVLTRQPLFASDFEDGETTGWGLP